MTFEEEFPSLIEAMWNISDEELFGEEEAEIIKASCLDKQRHEELMEQALAKERQRVREVIDKYEQYLIDNPGHDTALEIPDLIREELGL